MYEMYFSTIKSTDNSRAIEGLALLVGFVVSGVGAVIEPLRSEDNLQFASSLITYLLLSHCWDYFTSF